LGTVVADTFYRLTDVLLVTQPTASKHWWTKNPAFFPPELLRDRNFLVGLFYHSLFPSFGKNRVGKIMIFWIK